MDAFIFVKGKNYLTVTSGLKVIFSRIFSANITVIVNLTVDGEHLFMIGRV